MAWLILGIWAVGMFASFIVVAEHKWHNELEKNGVNRFGLDRLPRELRLELIRKATFYGITAAFIWTCVLAAVLFTFFGELMKRKY